MQSQVTIMISKQNFLIDTKFYPENTLLKISRNLFRINIYFKNKIVTVGEHKRESRQDGVKTGKNKDPGEKT